MREIACLEGEQSKRHQPLSADAYQIANELLNREKEGILSSKRLVERAKGSQKENVGNEYAASTEEKR